MIALKYFPEPLLQFRYDQQVEDPRDGLTLFGPLDALKPAGIRSAVVGTGAGIARFEKWQQSLQRPVYGTTISCARPFFPGFETAFRTQWQTDDALFFESTVIDWRRAIHIDENTSGI